MSSLWRVHALLLHGMRFAGTALQAVDEAVLNVTWTNMMFGIRLPLCCSSALFITASLALLIYFRQAVF